MCAWGAIVYRAHAHTPIHAYMQHAQVYTLFILIFTLEKDPYPAMKANKRKKERKQ